METYLTNNTPHKPHKPYKPKEQIMNHLQELYDLKCQEDALKAKQKLIKEKMNVITEKISQNAQFPGNKKTTYETNHGFKTKIEKKEDFSWNQEALNEARMTLGDEMFLTLFKFEWKHVSKPSIEQFLTGKQKQVLEDALTIKTTFAVSIEKETEANKEAAA